MGGDSAQAGGGVHLRTVLVVLFPARGEQAQRNQPIILDRLFKHLAVPWLEDVQGLHHMGKHHHVWQGEYPCQAGKLIGVEGEWFV